LETIHGRVPEEATEVYPRQAGIPGMDYSISPVVRWDFGLQQGQGDVEAHGYGDTCL